MSSIPLDAPWRGCASNFPTPPNQEDIQQAETWTRTLQQYNPNDGIVYRGSNRSHDVTHHVFRWNNTHYEQVFENGFQARPQDNTPSNVYYSLENHVNHGGVPLDPNRPIPHVFVSTTLSHGWFPPVEGRTEVFRYEIYAPGGIWVAQTLERYRYPRQDEVAFVGGVASQYIRSAQRFSPTYDDNLRRIIWQPADTQLIINHNFNPELLNIQEPVVDHWDRPRRRRVLLSVIFYEPPHRERRRRGLSGGSVPFNWYAEGVANSETYIDAAFRSSRKNEAYLFMQNEYVLINYAPGSKDDWVVNGPLLICDGYPSLAGSLFAECGIDCAFGSHDGNQAFIFSGNLCAHIDYAPHTTDDKIIKGPATIAKMFPFLKGTVFENGVDAAFESSRGLEAYLFKNNQYALISYGSDDSVLLELLSISEGFYSLRGTIFESGIDAAFASHRYNEAYIFKGDSYALINFAPGTTDDYIIGGVKPILPNWPSLNGILPHKNRGLDLHNHTTVVDPGDDHDEL